MEKRIITVDMHTHLLEKKVKLKNYWKRVDEVGLDAVAICEHSEIGAKKAYEALLNDKRSNAVLIAGTEINTNKGHVLALCEDDNVYSIPLLKKKEIDLFGLIDAAKENNLLLSISHPWGFDYDSLGYILGAREIEELVRKEFIGVEIYNGMIGYLSNFIYDSGWIKRPVNFIDFIEKNRVIRKTGIDRLGSRLRKGIDRKRMEVIGRNAKAVELGSIAKFVTAGSDAHSADRIGTGIMKIKFGDSELTARTVLEAMLKKDNVIWSGPLVKEVSDGMYEKVREPLKRKEILQGITYITKSIIKRKIRRKKPRGLLSAKKTI